MAEYAPKIKGDAYTSQASAAITAGMLCAVSGTGTVAKTAAANKAWVGVAAFDVAASGDKITIEFGGVQRILNTGGVTAGDLLESAANGAVATHTLGTNDGTIVGVALTTATTGLSVDVMMAR